MRNPNPLILAAALVLSPAPAAAEDDGLQEAVAIANRYGIARFDQLEEIHFTFNVRRGTTTFARAWTWRPADGRISVSTMESGKKFEHAYTQSALKEGDAARNEKADRWFVNDSYWLVFPFHLAWDRGLELTLEENRPLPIPPGRADCLTADYSAAGGYTPGDVYEVYFDPNHLILQWTFHKGGAPSPTIATTWEENASLGPIVVSLRHRSADGSTEIWFSDVQARRSGETAWLSPRPL